MSKRLFRFSLLLFCVICSAAENLIFNGDFSRLDVDLPSGWVLNPFASFFKEGGPDNKPFIRMVPGNNGAYENKFRQYDLTMVAGGKYKVSAWIRTKDFSSPNAAILLINEGWFGAAGIIGFPANSDWKRMEAEFVCPESKHENTYGFVCLAVGHKGFLDIADISLEALDEATAEKSKPTLVSRLGEYPRLVPWATNLNAIPLHAPETSFVWFGGVGKVFKPEEHLLTLKDEASGYISKPVALAAGEVPFKVSLAGLSAGWHKLTCVVANKNGGNAVISMPLWVQLKEMPRKEEITHPRRLNNFTCEYYNGSVTPGQTLDIALEHDKWFFIAFSNGEGSISVDSRNVLTKEMPRGECFCFLDAGRHSIKSENGGTLVIRSIAETLGSAMLEGPRMETFPKYDWEFTKKWAAGVITSYNRGNPSEEVLKECHSWGALWIGQLNAVRPASADDARSRLEKVIKPLRFDGATADEFGYEQACLDYWTQALKKFDLKRDRRIYTWCGLEPKNRAVCSDFIATCLNSSMGRGKVLSEVYMKSYDNEAEALESIRKELVEPFRKTRDFYPDMARRSGIILGNFNQIGVITLEHQAEVDYKYFLDVQMHTLATNPVFMDLGTTGYWGYHYTDEEMFRWSSRLLRYYVIEGHTDLLSKKYGFSYLPGHIQNNEFENELAGWTVNEAAPGNVSVGRCDLVSVPVQSRWQLNHDTRGNKYCQFLKAQGKASTLSQPVKGLVPGKQYMLLYCTMDLDDVKAKRLNPRKLGLNAALDNVTVNDSMVWIDKRVIGNYAPQSHVARMNVNRVIFTPKGTESKLSFSNSEAKDGEKLILNYIQVKPFYPFEP